VPPQRAGRMPCKGFIDYAWVFEALSSPFAFTPFVLIWAAALIWLLNSTAQEFFVPPLEYWSRRLNLTPELAGATLVALGNGAPDLAAVVTAARTNDLSLGLSEVLGANMSIICITGGVVCLMARKVCETPEPASCQAEDGLQVQGSEQTLADDGPKCDSSAGEVSATQVGNAAGFDRVSIGWYCATLAYLSFLVMTGRLSMQFVMPMPVLYLFYLLSLWMASSTHATPAPSEHLAIVHPSISDLPGLTTPLAISPLALLGWMLAWPTYLVRWVLIPSADLQWDARRRVLSSCSPCGLTLLWVACRTSDFQDLGMACQSSLLGLAMTLTLLIYVSSDDGPKLPWFYPGLTLLSKMSSIIVLSLIAGELTSLVEAVGLLGSIPRLWLGSTVISWGNSLGDLVTGMAMVRQGQMRAAMTAVFAGPLFNCLVGCGFALALACARQGGHAIIGTGAAKAVLLTNLGFLLVASLLATLSLRSIRQQGYSWVWPWLLFALYAIFLPCILALESGTS